MKSEAQENNVSVPREMINIPTAGSLQKGMVGVNLRLQPQGSLLAGFSAGFVDPLLIILYYGGDNLIGTGKVTWNPQIGIDIRYRIVEETIELPGLAVGFTNQGYGAYLKGRKRYLAKSKGFYLVSSKNYDFLGNFGFHLGANFSLENEDNDTDINFFIGLDKNITSGLSILGEYDFGLNDNEDDTFTERKGYLNAGIRWNFLGKFYLEFHFKDILDNYKNQNGITREVKIEFVENLFN